MGLVPACHSQGLSGPACVFQNVLEGLGEQDWFIGAETQTNRTELNMYYPISRGAITNWDNVEKVSYNLWGPVMPQPLPLALRNGVCVGFFWGVCVCVLLYFLSSYI